MKFVFPLSVAAMLLIASPALAYYTENDEGGGCSADGSACNVYCDNDDRAGIMFWNGSVWTDGVKSDEDFETEASAIVEANGTACT